MSYWRLNAEQGHYVGLTATQSDARTQWKPLTASRRHTLNYQTDVKVGQFERNVKFKETFPAACLEAWKYLFTNLVWIKSRFVFWNFHINKRVEIQKLKQPIKLNPGLPLSQLKTTGPEQLSRLWKYTSETKYIPMPNSYCSHRNFDGVSMLYVLIKPQ